MLERIQTILALVVVVILALLGVRRSGQNQGRREAEAKVEKETIETAEVARDEENKVGALSDDDVAARLRDKWTR